MKIDKPVSDKPWEYARFNQVPVVAAVTLLTKYQNDVLSAENHVIETLYGSISSGIERIDKLEAKNIDAIKAELLEKIQAVNGINFIGEIVEVSNGDALKKICFSLKNELKNYVIVLAASVDGKAAVAVMTDEIVASKNLDAQKIIKEHVAPFIKGGGGGQQTLATASGQDATKLTEIIETIKELL